MKNRPVKWTKKFYKVKEIENKIPFNSVKFWNVTTKETTDKSKNQGIFPTVVQDGENVSESTETHN